MTISVNELKESVIFPGILILMLLVYQIEKNLTAKDETEKKDE